MQTACRVLKSGPAGLNGGGFEVYGDSPQHLKIVLTLQLLFSKYCNATKTVSVAVSVLTLTFISVDRWYAICFPLKFKSTTGRAKTAILLIWLVALAIDIPELLALQTHSPELRVSSHLLTQCAPNWTTETEIIFLCVKVVLLYSLPLLLMSVAYWQIVRVLWRSDAIPGQSEVSSSSTTLASGGSSMSEYKPVIY
ncbi:Hypothetical predicted protein [Cloeon dipterum]|uniref:G-protein coupled receptors family 1 profile domain-containing protein n=1 Tax=Cloeon dipterum TaxID=197152 RepID=A0A8S1CXA7_9INSE|nr:Hypothetical predicted protein [Cloeon dipterum]